MMKTHLELDQDAEGSDGDGGECSEEEEEVLLLWANRSVSLKLNEDQVEQVLLYFHPSLQYSIRF